MLYTKYSTSRHDKHPREHAGVVNNCIKSGGVFKKKFLMNQPLKISVMVN